MSCSCKSKTEDNEGIRVSGVVVDIDGNPLPGANIYQPDSNPLFGVITDMDGNFEFKRPYGTKMTVSYLGFYDESFTVTQKWENVVLIESYEPLDAVVITNEPTPPTIEPPKEKSSIFPKILVGATALGLLIALFSDDEEEKKKSKKMNLQV